jgi:WD40 repeat protein
MSNQLIGMLLYIKNSSILFYQIGEPSLLPIDQPLQDYLNSSVFLTNNVWKIAFSPCSEYLAIPKQDIYGRYCVIIIRCSDWHSKSRTNNDLCVYNQFTCSSAIWSLAFGQRKYKANSILKPNLFNESSSSTPRTRRELLGRRRSSLSVNRRYDFTKNLFLAAGLADGKINIWNINTGELTLILKDHQSTVCGLDYGIYLMMVRTK